MSHHLHAYSHPDPGRLRGQMSPRNPLDRGRGRNAGARRRAHGPQPGEIEAFRRAWSLLMIASFPSREVCAVAFGVSFQTACNWFDGLVSPYGHQVARAARELPRFAEIMEVV